MSGPCTSTFEELAKQLGDFSCSGAHPVLNVHNPLHLTNWTLPVIEVTMLVGAALALRHAIQRFRAGDRSGLALWLASLVYLLAIEPPVYFPEKFGLEKQVGLVFVHNEFTLQFMWNRLPLYIVALYPAMMYLAYQLVQSLGVFRRHNQLVGAMTVGFVHQCFYEIFDHLGPELRWWIWNPSVKSNRPMLGVVPVSSLVIFGIMGVFAITFLVRRLVGDKLVAWRVIAAGVLVPVVLAVVGLPTSTLSRGGHVNAEGVVFAIEVLAFGAVAAYAIVTSQGEARLGDRYVLTHGGLYLAMIGLLWVSGLAHDPPAVSVAYAAVCAATCLALLVTAARAKELVTA